MSFLLHCPSCGPRSVYEFRFGGEDRKPSAPSASEEEWLASQYMRANVAGVQSEWWFHRTGCRQWLRVVRNTVTNEVLESELPGCNQK